MAKLPSIFDQFGASCPAVDPRDMLTHYRPLQLLAMTAADYTRANELLCVCKSASICWDKNTLLLSKKHLKFFKISLNKALDILPDAWITYDTHDRAILMIPAGFLSGCFTGTIYGPDRLPGEAE